MIFDVGKWVADAKAAGLEVLAYQDEPKVQFNTAGFVLLNNGEIELSPADWDRSRVLQQQVINDGEKLQMLHQWLVRKGQIV